MCTVYVSEKERVSELNAIKLYKTQPSKYKCIQIFYGFCVCIEFIKSFLFFTASYCHPFFSLCFFHTILHFTPNLYFCCCCFSFCFPFLFWFLFSWRNMYLFCVFVWVWCAKRLKIYLIRFYTQYHLSGTA